MPRVAILLVALVACHHDRAPAHAARELTVRVPGALRVARALDTLTVAIDPSAGADTTVPVAPGKALGVETETRVFAIGSPAPVGERHGYTSSATFDVGQSSFVVPDPEKKYVVEMKLVLFETDVPPGHMWDPHAGHYEALLTRTLRQAEE